MSEFKIYKFQLKIIKFNKSIGLFSEYWNNEFINRWNYLRQKYNKKILNYYRYVKKLNILNQEHIKILIKILQNYIYIQNLKILKLEHFKILKKNMGKLIYLNSVIMQIINKKRKYNISIYRDQINKLPK
jgi:3-polyprenyl-4-hydroxybenzoate decarboxylase